MTSGHALETPATGRLGAWCRALIEADSLAGKLAPPNAPDARSAGAFLEIELPLRGLVPSRPAPLEVVERSPKAPRPGALVRPEPRARLLHTLLHHELQAAELFAFAFLNFPETPREFRAGLVRLAEEELAHARLYRGRLIALGFDYGAFPVRDWFWQRVGTVRTPLEFVAVQGLGLEAGNLEHGARLAAALRTAGDGDSAAVLEQVEREEIGHVTFARHWFERLSGAPLDFEAWSRALPEPLSPAVLRGWPLNRRARERAGLSAEFLDALEAVPPVDPRAKRNVPQRPEPAP